MRFYIDRAKNAELWDIEGRRYIDFAGGIGVLNTGHLNDKVAAAVAVKPRNSATPAIRLCPTSCMCRWRKTQRHHPGRPRQENRVLHHWRRSRGKRHQGGAQLHRPSGRDRLLWRLPRSHQYDPGPDRQSGPVQTGLWPLPGEVFHAPYPNPMHGVSEEEALKGLERFSRDIDPKRVAAIIIEPVQGEGGFNVTPNSFLGRAARHL